MSIGRRLRRASHWLLGFSFFMLACYVWQGAGEFRGAFYVLFSLHIAIHYGLMTKEERYGTSEE